MRLIGYNRVSTEEQARFGHSLEIQPAIHSAWCSAMGHTLVDVVADPGVSAGKVPFQKRVGGREVMRRLEAGEADGVVVVRFDRAFRIAVDGLQASEWFMKRGFSFISIEQPVDISTDFGWYVFGQMCLTAELERRTIVRRAQETSEGLRQQGKVWGGVPFGCVQAGDRLYRCPTNWPLRERIVQLRKQGEAGEPLSLRKLAAALRRQGIAAPNGGKLWHVSTLSNILDTHHELQHIQPLPLEHETEVSL